MPFLFKGHCLKCDRTYTGEAGIFYCEICDPASHSRTEATPLFITKGFMNPYDIKKKIWELSQRPDTSDQEDGYPAIPKEVCEHAETLALHLPWVKNVDWTADGGISVTFESINGIVHIFVEYYDGAIDSAACQYSQGEINAHDNHNITARRIYANG